MSTIDSPAIGTATINAVSVDCPAKTNLTLHVGPSHAEWGGRHELDTIYCAVGVYDTVTATRKAPGSGFSLNLEGAYLGDLASSGSDMRRNHAVLALFAMAEASGHEPDVALNIDKRIPVGAGMAGAVAARELAERGGKKVLVLDRRCGGDDSGIEHVVGSRLADRTPAGSRGHAGRGHAVLSDRRLRARHRFRRTHRTA